MTWFIDYANDRENDYGNYRASYALSYDGSTQVLAPRGKGGYYMYQESLWLMKAPTLVFTARVTTLLSSSDWKFYGRGAVVGLKVYFAPWEAPFVGVYEPLTGNFSTVALPQELTTSGYKSDAIAVGTRVFFIPGHSVHSPTIGVLETSNNSWSNVSGPTALNGRYRGVAKVNKMDGGPVMLYFAPNTATNIGILNTQTNAFTTLDTSSVAQGNRYYGAAAIGEKVVFCPYIYDNVGVFDTATSQFTTVPTTGITTGGYKYTTATAVATKVIFGPGDQANVGIFDVATGNFSTAAAPGLVYTGSYPPPLPVAEIPAYISPLLTVLGANNKAFYTGAAAIGMKVYFSPHHGRGYAGEDTQKRLAVFDVGLSVFKILPVTMDPGTWSGIVPGVSGTTYIDAYRGLASFGGPLSPTHSNMTQPQP